MYGEYLLLLQVLSFKGKIQRGGGILSTPVYYYKLLIIIFIIKNTSTFQFHLNSERRTTFWICHCKFLWVVFTVTLRKNKSKTIVSKKSRILQVVEKYNINYSSKSHGCTVSRTRVIRQNVSRKFREHSMESPCWSLTAWAPTWRPEINKNIWH